MRQFVLLLAVFLDAFASDNALAVPAQGPQHILLGNVDPLGHLDGNRALQVVNEGLVDDEERAPELGMLMPLLESEKMVEQALKTEVDTRAHWPFWKQFLLWIMQIINKFKARRTLMDVYKEQQKILASTPAPQQNDKLMLLGHSPIIMMNVFDARDSEVFTKLRQTERLSEREQLGQLSRFITCSQEAVSDGKGDAIVSVPTWQNTYESLTIHEKYRVDEQVQRYESVITSDISAEDLVKRGINPILYLIMLIKKGDIKPPSEDAVIYDIIDTEYTALFKAKGITDAELMASYNPIAKFKQFVEVFEMNLEDLKVAVEKAMEASGGTRKVVNNQGRGFS